MRGNGQNDPRSPIYWKLQNFSEEEAILKAKEKCRESSPRCKEFWIKKGFSEEEAKFKVGDFQNRGSANTGSKRTEEQKLKMRETQMKIKTIEYWTDKYGKELGIEKYNKWKLGQVENGKRCLSERKKKNPNTFIENSVRRKEYWIKKGYSEQEAKMMVSKQQSRGVDFYIKKYGIEDGCKRWEERNEKWYNSFYNSGNDLTEINEKRKLNCHVGYYCEETIKNIKTLNFYMIILKDTSETRIIKYGLTKQDNISKRWKICLDYNIFFFEEMDSRIALDLEMSFHKKFKNSYKPSIIKTTECFEYNADNLNCAVQILSEFNLKTFTRENNGKN
jgi:hypothetical protein